jgi:peptide/nickel transport system permease protein
MLNYIIRRLLTFIPTLVVISLLAFIISINAPGDPIERLLSSAESGSGDVKASSMDKEKESAILRKKLGLNLPVFYFSLNSLADVDTLFLLSNPDHRSVIKRIARETGQPENTMNWFRSLLKAEELANTLKPDSAFIKSPGYLDKISRVRFLIASLTRTSDSETRSAREDSLRLLLSTTPGFKKVGETWKHSDQLLQKMQATQISWKKWIPELHFYGINCQYHHWLFGDGADRKGILRGDFGISYRDGLPISHRIGPRLKWSVFLSVLSILIAWMISVPVGIYAGYKKNKTFDTISGMLVFGLYALPSFFVGTLLLVFFANPDILDWFPSTGVKDPMLFDPNWPFWKRIMHYIPYLVLPLITYVYSSFAFISRQVRASISTQLSEDYIRTARAKGLSDRIVVLRHALRNSLLPLITIISETLPLTFGGSIIIETLFSIPGMGLEIYESILNYDYPMIISVFTLYGTLTLLGYLLADIGYALADPRIRYSSETR